MAGQDSVNYASQLLKEVRLFIYLFAQMRYLSSIYKVLANAIMPSNEYMSEVCYV